MARRALGVDTASDELTQACLDARDANVYPDFTNQGVDVTRLTGGDATAASVIAALTPDIGLLSLSSHGLPDRVVGQSDTIFTVGSYPPAAVNGKIIHFLACESAAQLGVDLVQNGCAAFFGYSEEFLFPIAKPSDFLDCDAMIDSAIASGMTADDVYRTVIAFFNKRIAQLKQDGEVFRASMLQHNRDCLCAPSVDARWGDPGAQLRD